MNCTFVRGNWLYINYRIFENIAASIRAQNCKDQNAAINPELSHPSKIVPLYFKNNSCKQSSSCRHAKNTLVEKNSYGNHAKMEADVY